MVNHLGLALFSALLVTCSLDPVHDKAVADLGPEMPPTLPGPTHRPGQPCLVCHDGSTANPAMSAGGTVYGAFDSSEPLGGANVELFDSKGSSFTATTNGAGNFFVERAAWQPVFPVRVAIEWDGFRVSMTTLVGQDGSCATCHVDPPSRVSAGIVIGPSAATIPDGGGGP